MKCAVDAVALFVLAAVFASFAQAVMTEGERESTFILIGAVQGQDYLARNDLCGANWTGKAGDDCL